MFRGAYGAGWRAGMASRPLDYLVPAQPDARLHLHYDRDTGNYYPASHTLKVLREAQCPYPKPLQFFSRLMWWEGYIAGSMEQSRRFNANYRRVA